MFKKLLSLLIFALISVGFAQQTWNIEYRQVPADHVMPTGQSIAVECQDEGADYPYTPYDWPDRKATMTIEQSGATSKVFIEMTGVKPNQYYTMWLRLLGTDAQGNKYGGNPLIGIPGTPLIPSTELDEALTFTGKGNAKEGLTNGFWSDERGNATFSTTLDFPIISGAYPFQNFENFDVSDARFTSPFQDTAPMPIPVAIANTGAPFTLRIASHCGINKNFGLFPGPHEGWFDWLVDEDYEVTYN